MIGGQVKNHRTIGFGNLAFQNPVGNIIDFTTQNDTTIIDGKINFRNIAQVALQGVKSLTDVVDHSHAVNLRHIAAKQLHIGHTDFQTVDANLTIAEGFNTDDVLVTDTDVLYLEGYVNDTQRSHRDSEQFCFCG